MDIRPHVALPDVTIGKKIMPSIVPMKSREIPRNRPHEIGEIIIPAIDPKDEKLSVIVSTRKRGWELKILPPAIGGLLGISRTHMWYTYDLEWLPRAFY